MAATVSNLALLFLVVLVKPSPAMPNKNRLSIDCHYKDLCPYLSKIVKFAEGNMRKEDSYPEKFKRANYETQWDYEDYGYGGGRFGKRNDPS